MSPTSQPHPLVLWLLKALLFLLGISALIPGIEMILDPSGQLVGFPEGSLANSPFPNYLIPGFLLTAFIGLRLTCPEMLGTHALPPRKGWWAALLRRMGQRWKRK